MTCADKCIERMVYSFQGAALGLRSLSLDGTLFHVHEEEQKKKKENIMTSNAV